jgi:hypothetical protein
MEKTGDNTEQEATTKTPQWSSKNNGIPQGRRKDEGTKEEGVI